MSSLWVYFWTLKPTLNLHQAGSDKNASLLYQIVLVTRASLVAQRVKNLPTMQKMRIFDPWVGKIPWRKGVATRSSILAWNSVDREAWWTIQSMELQRVRQNRMANTFTLSYVTELIEVVSKINNCWMKIAGQLLHKRTFISL